MEPKKTRLGLAVKGLFGTQKLSRTPMYFRNSPSFQNLRNSNCSVVISETVFGNNFLETPGKFWEWPQAGSTFAFQFLILFLTPMSAHSHSVMHGMNGHTHSFQLFLTFRHESSTRELPEIH